MIINEDYHFKDGVSIDKDILENGIVDIEMITGNVCNLQCMICSSADSTRWRTADKKLHDNDNGIEVDFSYPADVETERLKDKQYVEDILEYKKLKRLTFLGGEPFLGQLNEHIGILEKLDKTYLQSVEYITNGTMIPHPKIVEQWDKIERIEIDISVDGVCDVFEYNRFPGKWIDLENTVDFYLQLRETQPHVDLSILTTVSIVNAMGLKELMEWAADKNIKVVLAPLENPVYYSLRSAPETIKPLIYKAWEGISQLDPFIEFMKQHPSKSEHIADTKKHIEAMDNITNQSFKTLFPEYATLLNIIT